MRGATALSWVLVHSALAENPIRKVVNMLQELKAEAVKEGETEKNMYDKAMCFCKSNIQETSDEIDANTDDIAKLEGTTKELSGSIAQLQSEVKQLSKDLEEDTQSLDSATEVRRKEETAYADETNELTVNIRSLDVAIPKLEAGLSASLIELRPMLLKASKMMDSPDGVVSLLQSKSTSGGGSEILGILKQMRDNFKENLTKMMNEETAAVKEFRKLKAAKDEEIRASKSEMEEKRGRAAKQSQLLSEAKEDLEDTEAMLEENQTKLINLKSQCKEREESFEAAEQARAEEVKAINETIEFLNNDDSLELFNNTLKKPASFAQMTMKGKGFDKLMTMVDKMIAQLQVDAKQDEKHLDSCKARLDKSADAMASNQQQLVNEKQVVSEAEQQASTVQDALTLLDTEIKQLDQNVQQAGVNRQAENAAYKQTKAEQLMANEILEKAANRMKKQYAKKEPKSPEEEDFLQQNSLVDTADMLGLSFLQIEQDPRAAGGLGIVAMIEKIRSDISVEVQKLDSEETNSQKEYEQLVKDSKDAKDTKQEAVTNKNVALSRQKEVRAKGNKQAAGTQDELNALNETDGGLHSDCDFLIKNFDARKEARTNEMEGLKKSKAVLAGADYGSSFVQVKQLNRLTRVR